MRRRSAAALLLALAQAAIAHAAPCCGGGAVAPTILTGDDRAQFSASIAQSQVIGDAYASGLPVFRADGDVEQSQTLRLEGAYLLSDRWQVGATVPVIRRARSTPAMSDSNLGLGDIGLSGAYEILPEWEYSVWRPRGFVFVDALIPAGGSVYQASLESADPWGLSARGRGFYSLGVGGLLLKGWGPWDASVTGELHHSFARTFNAADGDLALTPGWGGSLGLAGGYSFVALPIRLGIALAPSFEGPIRALSPSIDETSDGQLVWNASLQLGWMPSRTSTVSAIYTDQTWFGPAYTSSLSRTVALLFQQRWER